MEEQVELQSMPSLFSLYRKIFFGRKPGWDQQPLPHLNVSVKNVTVEPKKVIEYAQVCGFEFDGKQLPSTYLYVMAFRLYALVFTSDQITFPLIGMIHLRNSIKHYRPVNVDEVFDINCLLGESRETDVGLEFDIQAQVIINGELVWECESTYLYRIEKSGRRARPPRGSDMNWEDACYWTLGDDLGRRYAKASGDYNLIHLHPVLSKRFGFDRVLAHGMWSKARCIAELTPQIADRAYSVDVAFKLPLFMPADVSFCAVEDENGYQFELRDKKGRRPHLTGNVSFLDKHN